MLQNRRLLEELLRDDELTPRAVEEFVRYESPGQFSTRRVAVDVEVGGQLLKAGETVMAFLGAANRDERVFPEADRLILDRHPNKHLAFGFNIHFVLALRWRGWRLSSPSVGSSSASRPFASAKELSHGGVTF